MHFVRKNSEERRSTEESHMVGNKHICNTTAPQPGTVYLLLLVKSTPDLYIYREKEVLQLTVISFFLFFLGKEHRRRGEKREERKKEGKKTAKTRFRYFSNAFGAIDASHFFFVLRVFFYFWRGYFFLFFYHHLFFFNVRLIPQRS